MTTFTIENLEIFNFNCKQKIKIYDNHEGINWIKLRLQVMDVCKNKFYSILFF